MGTVLSRPPAQKRYSSKRPGVSRQEEEEQKIIVSNYAQIIRKKRAKSGVTQEDFAKQLRIKESLLHKIETGSFEPSLVLAQQLERILKIKLIETFLHKKVDKNPDAKASALTIGDMIKFKGKKI